jgi:hypothetical protein
MLARDSIVYFIIIFGLCALALGVIGTNFDCSLFLACLLMDIVSNVDESITIQVST